MGLPYGMLTLRNPRSPKSDPVEVEALADSGAVYLIIPEHIRLQLALEESGTKEITLADGSKKMVPYVGPIEKSAYVGAVHGRRGPRAFRWKIWILLPYHSKEMWTSIPSIPILRRRRRNKWRTKGNVMRYSFAHSRLTKTRAAIWEPKIEE